MLEYMVDETLEAEESQQEEVIDPPEIDSKYRLILLAAQRSKQLQRGALPRVELDPREHKPTRIALKEFENRRVNFSLLDGDKKEEE